MFALTDFVPPEDWGPEYPIPGTIRNNIPMPTLYSADGRYITNILILLFLYSVHYLGLKSRHKLSIVELVLYNMAALLAGVATGYDVRLSNVSPVHPRLQPNR